MSDTKSKFNKKNLLAAALAGAVTLGASSALAEMGMEKCKIVDENGKGLIKEKQADCAGKTHSCKGQNVEGDPDSWILLPKGACDKIKGGSTL